MKSAEFVLSNHSDSRTLRMAVQVSNGMLHVYAEGYGQPVTFDYYDGKLTLIVDKPPAESPDLYSLEPNKGRTEWLLTAQAPPLRTHPRERGLIFDADQESPDAV